MSALREQLIREAGSLDAAFAQAVAYENRRYAKSVHEWMENVYTIDEADSSVKLFPDKAYVRDALAILEAEPMIAFAKSRRTVMTWTVSAFITHRARYFPGTAVFWQSDTEDKSAFVVGRRCGFIEDNLPEHFQRRYIAHRTAKGEVGRMEYPGAGYIWGVAQGESVLRTYTPTILVLDESEFQQEGVRAITTALPFVEKGAKLVLISTPNGPSGPMAEIAKSVGFQSFPASGR